MKNETVDVNIELDQQKLAPNKDFKQAFKGKFYGVLKWEQLDALWDIVKKDSDNGWYVYAIGEVPPATKIKDETLETVINELDVLLRREHNEDYCGIVYTDDLKTPSFIKVFDPNNIGTSCSISKIPPLPGWIISKLPPSDLSAPVKQTAKRKRWWDRLLNIKKHPSINNPSTN